MFDLCANARVNIDSHNTCERTGKYRFTQYMWTQQTLNPQSSNMWVSATTRVFIKHMSRAWHTLHTTPHQRWFLMSKDILSNTNHKDKHRHNIQNENNNKFSNKITRTTTFFQACESIKEKTISAYIYSLSGQQLWELKGGKSCWNITIKDHKRCWPFDYDHKHSMAIKLLNIAPAAQTDSTQYLL